MENLLTYIIQVNLLLAIVFLGYQFLLKSLTFYTLNRMYFILGTLYALIYPLVDLKKLLVRDALVAIPVLWDYVTVETVEQISKSYSLYDVLLVGIAIGVVLFVGKLIMQLISLLRIHYYSKEVKWQTYLFRDVFFPVVPFSFFNKIYLHQAQHHDVELNDILEHETIHVRGQHTWDVLLFEILLIGCWYNPFVWLMRKAVRQNLEYLTDQQVLNKGTDRQAYQYSLLNVTQRGAAVGIGNQFNFKILKKRIMMMNKKRSSRVELSKYAFLLPIMLLAGASFTVSQAESKIVEVVDKAQKTELINEPFLEKMKGDVGELLNTTIGSELIKIDTSKQKVYNADYPLVPSDFDRNELRAKNFYFKIDDKQVSLDEFYDFPRNKIFGVDIYSDKDDIFKKIGKQNAEGLFVINTMKWAEENLPVSHLEKLVKEDNLRGLTFTVVENGKKRIIKGESANMDELRKNFPHVYTNATTDDNSVGYVLDGKLVDIAVIKSLDAKAIESVVMNSNNALTKKYNKKTILNIITKKYAGTEGTPSEYKAFVIGSDNNVKISGPLRGEGGSFTEIRADTISLDLSQNKSQEQVDLHKLKSKSEIDSRKSYLYEYDQKLISKEEFFKISDAELKNIILVTNKQLLQNRYANQVDLSKYVGIVRANSIEGEKKLQDQTNRVLLVVDGIEKGTGKESMKDVNPNDIESMNVLKGKAAVIKYGEKAADGAIEIKTKTANSNSAKFEAIEYKGKSETMARLSQNSKSFRGEGVYIEEIKKPIGEIVLGANPNAKPPLFVVDGIEKKADFDMKVLKEEEIESISVLKDQTATAVYGEKGVNGVILITTKDSIKKKNK